MYGNSGTNDLEMPDRKTQGCNNEGYKSDHTQDHLEGQEIDTEQATPVSGIRTYDTVSETLEDPPGTDTDSHVYQVPGYEGDKMGEAPGVLQTSEKGSNKLPRRMDALPTPNGTNGTGNHYQNSPRPLSTFGKEDLSQIPMHKIV